MLCVFWICVKMIVNSGNKMVMMMMMMMMMIKSSTSPKTLSTQLDYVRAGGCFNVCRLLALYDCLSEWWPVGRNLLVSSCFGLRVFWSPYQRRKVCCSLLLSSLVDEPNETMMDAQRPDWIFRVNWISRSWCRLNLLSRHRTYILCMAFWLRSMNVLFKPRYFGPAQPCFQLCQLDTWGIVAIFPLQPTIVQEKSVKLMTRQTANPSNCNIRSIMTLSVVKWRSTEVLTSSQSKVYAPNGTSLVHKPWICSCLASHLSTEWSLYQIKPMTVMSSANYRT